MYLADYHVHSQNSVDARFPMADMAEGALAAGLNELCFTDHVEPMMDDRVVHMKFDWPACAREFEALREAVGDKIRLRLGAELGDVFLDMPYLEETMAKAPPLDFLIGSNHMLSEKYGWAPLDRFRPAGEKEAQEAVEDYLIVEKRMVQWGRFDVLGHLTLPLRYFNEKQGFHATFDGLEDQMEEILRLAVEKGLGIEVNTNRGGMPLPDEKWLRMYRRLGGEIVTLGSDAHSPERVGTAIRENQELLRQCGFTRFCTFERRKPVWHELS